MRIRSIKPEFWRDEAIVTLPITARLTFIGMWSYVDDNGVGSARLSSIIGDLYSEDMARDPQETLQRVSGDLQQLENAGMLTRYTHPNNPERELLYITNWTKHQIVNRPSKGNEYPLPPAETPNTPETLQRVSRVSQETLSAGAGEQGSRGAEEQRSSSLPTTTRSKPKHVIPDAWKPTDKHEETAREKNLDLPYEAQAFRNHAESVDRRLVNWNSAFSNWLLKAKPKEDPTKKPIDLNPWRSR